MTVSESASCRVFSWPAALLLLAFSCATAPDPEPPSRALLAAPPGRWAELLPPVLAFAAGATDTLTACLHDAPDAPGAEAVAFALGETGDPRAIPVLMKVVANGGSAATEAALALGKLQATDAVTLLRDVAADPSRNPAERTAAAAALLDLGEVDAALPLLEAVLLAGTPAGQELARGHGLPSRQRWAHERWMAIQAIGRFTGGDTFGLDPDASWPRLEAGVAALRAHVDAARRRERR